MSSGFSSELKGELLDDFYAECDELFLGVRGSLIQLEKLVGKRQQDASVVEALFRGTHSLKGISAIVGLRPVEQLAHGMEELLRNLSKRGALVKQANVDALQAATQRMEQIVAGHRSGKPLPTIDDVLTQLRRVAPPPAESAAREPAPSRPRAETDPLRSLRDSGLKPYRAFFSPSPALDQRGVNVNAVRARLKELGEIAQATPTVKQGAVMFEFLIGAHEEIPDVALWEADGIRLERVPEDPATQSRPSTIPIDEASLSESLSLTPSHMVRVDLARLDDLMRITGEMVIQRSRFEERINLGGTDRADLKEINMALARSLRELREAISRVRMVPIGEIFNRMPFVVRDLARQSEKKVQVSLEGHQTEVDKYLVERLKEPLLHLVRNAFVHGIESPAERAQAGKPREATILLRARSEGQSVIIQIRDDGRGIDPTKVAARASVLGLAVGDSLDADALLNVLCAPGFSTREAADLASGRGVGMAVVANVVRDLGGTLGLDTTLGVGTEFTLRLPLTLSIAGAIIVSVGAQTCAVPQSAVNEIVQVPARDARTIQRTVVVPYRKALLPIVMLRTMFNLAEASVETLTILVVSGERGAVGLVVDRVRSQREIVIRPLSDSLLKVPGISGATELGDGRPILVLDPTAIAQGVVRPPGTLDESSAAVRERAS